MIDPCATVLNKAFDPIFFSEHVDFDLDERIWQMERLTYMRWDDGPTLDSTWSIKTDLNLINDYDFLRNNGSLYLHAFFFPTGKKMNFPTKLKNAFSFRC